MMTRPGMRRPFAVAAISACLLLSACEGSDGEVRKSGGTSARSGDPAAAAPASNDITVAFQLTGLMLIVPPTTNGGRTRIILPTVSDPEHVAGIAFGAAPSQVCWKYDDVRGLCFVRLADWALDSIGERGVPTITAGLAFPDGVVDVSRGSGNHKVNTGASQQSIHMTLDFLSGQPQRVPACRLGRWRYKPVGQGPRSIPLVNVMRWDIQHPRKPGLTLRFRSASGVTDSVVLNRTVNNTVRVLLAYIPDYEWEAIAEGRKVRQLAPDTLTHFRDYYKLLRHPDTHDLPDPVTHQPLPTWDGETGEACQAEVTGTQVQIIGNKTRIQRSTFRLPGIGTYACVVATGQG